MAEDTLTMQLADQDAPVIAPGYTLASVTDKVATIPLEQSKFGSGWFIGFGIASSLLLVMAGSIGYLFAKGTGIWGINMPNAWGFAIINFVWWIGIGHAGTLISAFLLLMNQQWRTRLIGSRKP